MTEQLSWEKIKELYPHQYVGLVDIIPSVNSVSVKSARVKYTDKDTSYNDLLLMCMKGEISLFYTTADEDDLLGMLAV